MPVRTISGPYIEPVGLEEAKQHLRIELDVVDDDAYIRGLVTAARSFAETTLCERAFVEQTLEYTTDSFRSIIWLPMPPLKEITEFVYRDSEGTEHTLEEDEDYLVDAHEEPAKIIPKSHWPAVQLYPVHPIRIRYVAGYDTPPEELKQWIKILIGHYYENREAILPLGHNIMRSPYGIDWLLQGYRTFGRADS